MMYTPEKREFFVMGMIDFRRHHIDGWQAPITLDGLVSDTYGRTYVGQQTGDMIANDSHVLFEMNEDAVREALDDYDDWAGGRRQFQNWLDDKTEYKYDFEHYRQAPTPDVALALLIDDGHLPMGDYLIEVSW